MKTIRLAQTRASGLMPVVLGALLLASGPALAARKTEWQFTFADAPADPVSGEVMSATLMMNNLTVAGRAYGEQPGQSAPQKFRMTITRSTSGEVQSALLNLTLPDGTRCRSTRNVELDIQDDDSKTLALSMTGELDCDGDERSFEGWVDADP